MLAIVNHFSDSQKALKFRVRPSFSRYDGKSRDSAPTSSCYSVPAPCEIWASLIPSPREEHEASSDRPGNSKRIVHARHQVPVPYAADCRLAMEPAHTSEAWLKSHFDPVVC